MSLYQKIKSAITVRQVGEMYGMEPDRAYCLRVLTDYLDLLHDWRERYKPASPEEPLDERFVEALHMTETIEHLTDCIAFGTPQQKAAAAARLLSGSYLLMLEERTDRLALAKCA